MMFKFGLIGYEYDDCLLLLKRRLEDRGHKARILNPTRIPRVVQTAFSPEKMIYDGFDVREGDCYFLSEMGLREPFFHVSYDRELWTKLRGRYLKFAADETANLNFTIAMINILTFFRPIVNPPHIYASRLHYPVHLHRLAGRSFNVPSFMTATTRPDGYDEAVPLNLDEYKNWEVLSFPKKGQADLRLWCKRPGGVKYKLIVMGKRLMDEVLLFPETDKLSQKKPLAGVPEEVVTTALKAAGELDIKFGEVTCVYADHTTWLMGIDPSPDINNLENVHNLGVSSALADYLIDIAANTGR
ncbi:MAG: hypothetical protein PHN52_08150 [candidate division Zixibacteria bacterium]|nr:hypothetical protein [candidate division Zixibacteria bacterium]